MSYVCIFNLHLVETLSLNYGGSCCSLYHDFVNLNFGFFSYFNLVNRYIFYP
jgi:hypothetical protein